MADVAETKKNASNKLLDWVMSTRQDPRSWMRGLGAATHLAVVMLIASVIVGITYLLGCLASFPYLIISLGRPDLVWATIAVVCIRLPYVLFGSMFSMACVLFPSDRMAKMLSKGLRVLLWLALTTLAIGVIAMFVILQTA